MDGSIGSGHELSAAERGVEAEFPGWHLFYSDAGNIWAVTTRNPYGGSGVTLTARTPELMRHEIAQELYEWERAGARAEFLNAFRGG